MGKLIEHHRFESKKEDRGSHLVIEVFFGRIDFLEGHLSCYDFGHNLPCCSEALPFSCFDSLSRKWMKAVIGGGVPSH